MPLFEVPRWSRQKKEQIPNTKRPKHVADTVELLILSELFLDHRAIARYAFF